MSRFFSHHISSYQRFSFSQISPEFFLFSITTTLFLIRAFRFLTRPIAKSKGIYGILDKAPFSRFPAGAVDAAGKSESQRKSVKISAKKYRPAAAGRRFIALYRSLSRFIDTIAAACAVRKIRLRERPAQAAKDTVARKARTGCEGYGCAKDPHRRAVGRAELKIP